MTASNRHPSRRDFLRLTTAGLAGVSLSAWFSALAADPQRKRSCILLWMAGGPSQMDTFDLKPGHKNGGPIQEIATSVPGTRISENLPQVAAQMKYLAIVRSMHTKEGDHGRATYHLRTGYPRQGPIHYPALGALVSHEIGTAGAELPNFVSIASGRDRNPAASGPGFLGPQHAPLVVGGGSDNLQVQDLRRGAGVGEAQAEARIDLLRGLENDFVEKHPDPGPQGHQASYERAVRLMKPDAARAFSLEEEKSALRDRYGRNRFGQSCLLARRLIERGVPFVEVSLGGWDTHFQNFPAVRRLCETLDPAWATLLTDLEQRGLLDTTLVVWMGEFGRTPQINGQVGRDHFPAAWTTVLGGGGIAGGQVVGRTSADGVTVEDRPVSVPDFMATICRAMGLDPAKQNRSNVGRPIRLADAGATPIKEVLR